MLTRALQCDIIYYFVFVATPKPAIKVGCCVAVRECRQHVLFVERIDVSCIQVTFVKSLGPVPRPSYIWLEPCLRRSGIVSN